MLYIIIAILIFGVLVATHELGHFASAKLLGVQVNEFAVGMGPALLKWGKGETLYSLRVLPIGGFCALEGDDEESSDPRAFGRAAWWKKVIILCAGAFVNFITGVIIIAILYAPAQGFRAGPDRHILPVKPQLRLHSRRLQLGIKLRQGLPQGRQGRRRFTFQRQRAALKAGVEEQLF